MPNPRSDYSNIFERPRLELPNNARIAVWVIINVEEWDINEPMARTILPPPQGRSVTPDIPNYAWYDYGMRVGFWRLKRVLDRPRDTGDGQPQRRSVPHIPASGRRVRQVGLGTVRARVPAAGAQHRSGPARGYPPVYQHDSGVLRLGSSWLDGSRVG